MCGGLSVVLVAVTGLTMVQFAMRLPAATSCGRSIAAAAFEAGPFPMSFLITILAHCGAWMLVGGYAWWLVRRWRARCSTSGSARLEATASA